MPACVKKREKNWGVRVKKSALVVAMASRNSRPSFPPGVKVFFLCENPEFFDFAILPPKCLLWRGKKRGLGKLLSVACENHAFLGILGIFKIFRILGILFGFFLALKRVFPSCRHV